jgi:serine/threonine protein phosphatase 1
MRKFVIGDIHGGYLGLVQVLEKVNFDYDNDMLISLGDVTDGWPQVAESIELLMQIKHLIYIKGNHDEWTERFLRPTIKLGPSDYTWNWYRQGGKATYHSYYYGKLDLVDKHMEFISNALPYYLDDENRLFLHAGLDPDIDLDKQHYTDVGQINKEENATFYWDRHFWRHMVDRFRIGGVSEVWDRYKEIYIGHTPTIRQFEDGLPVNIGNVWNMDTGATYNGKLSLMNLDTKEIVQSDPLYDLYPEHKGRNDEYLSKNKADDN